MRVDFHIHTEYSMDSVSEIKAVYQKAKEIGLGKLVITDHNTIAGAVKLKEKYPDYVIVGEEIMTTEGEILALFVKKEIPAGLVPEKVLEELEKQGAFISLSHPGIPGKYGWRDKRIIDLIPYLDAIEIANGRNLWLLNDSAQKFAEDHNLHGTAGSDAHGIPEIGRMGLEIDKFNTPDELRTVIGSAAVYGSLSNVFVRYYSRKAAFLKHFRHAVPVGI